jgi:hypothetical protein
MRQVPIVSTASFESGRHFCGEIAKLDAVYARQRLVAGEERVCRGPTRPALRFDVDVCEQSSRVECVQGIGRDGDDFTRDSS